MKPFEGGKPQPYVMNDVMTPHEKVSIPLDESLMTPLERRLRSLEMERQQRRASGKQETIAQQRDYEDIVWQNIVSDLIDLGKIVNDEKDLQPSASGYARTLDALIAAGYLPKDIWSQHPVLIEETRNIAKKKLELLRESNERLKMLDGALCMPSDHCEGLDLNRESVLHTLEGKWEVN